MPGFLSLRPPASLVCENSGLAGLSFQGATGPAEPVAQRFAAIFTPFQAVLARLHQSAEYFYHPARAFCRPTSVPCTV